MYFRHHTHLGGLLFVVALIYADGICPDVVVVDHLLEAASGRDVNFL
jgi:hypothetical protein